MCIFFPDEVKANWFSFGRLVTTVVDVGPPADWVKINVRENVSIFVYLLSYIFISNNYTAVLTKLLSEFF